MAPDIVKNLPYGQRVDWWAVGFMIFQIRTGHPPSYYDKDEDWDVDHARRKYQTELTNVLPLKSLRSLTLSVVAV
jgi:serine/threonine protein kinase